MQSKLVFALLALVAVVSHAADFNTLTSKEKADGWKLLFNGKDTTGWRLYGKQTPPGAGWKVEDGVLKKLDGQTGGDIITDQEFNDFELSWDWRVAPRGNNGVKYFVTESRPKAPGHEYQMIDDNDNPDGKLGPKRQTASFYDVLPPSSDKKLKPVGEWNSSKITVKDSHVEHWLNGAKVLTYDLGSPEVKKGLQESKFKDAPGFGDKIKGHIMLTDHHDECWFRSIKIRELQ